jgi:branched-chain amino acid transport system substrate-binding protein
VSDEWLSRRITRRSVLQAGARIGALPLAAAFATTARAANDIKFGLNNPLSGSDAELGRHEHIGCRLAIDEINAKGGILGRNATLLVEDSTSADTRVAVKMGRKLIERDKVDFLLGNVNSAMAGALGNLSNQLKTLHIVTGGHGDLVTGGDCHWNVFRVCSTTRMKTNALVRTLVSKYGSRWYFLTPDHAFGRSLQQGFEAALRQYGGTDVGASLTAPGTTDYSSHLTEAQTAKPDVVVFLQTGRDAVNALKQAVQLGLDKKAHIAGVEQELEVLKGLPPEARIATWVLEWYWLQPDVPHVSEFAAKIRKVNGGKVPTARHWFGYVAVWTCALVANAQKTLDAVKLAKALEGFQLPAEVALMPNNPFYRAGDHQLMPTLYVGHAVEKEAEPQDFFDVDERVKGVDAALPVAETGCHLKWPA